MNYKPYLLAALVFFTFARTAGSQELNFETPQLEVKKEKTPWERITPSLDARFIYLLKECPSSAGREGMSIMQAILGLDFELSSDLTAVTRYNLGFLGTGPREVYLQYALPEIDAFKVGRFPLTFGLKFSDHRIYTKRFFLVSSNDFETGMEVSKSLGDLKLTFALVQGLGGGEAFVTNETLITPAADLRVDFGGDEMSGLIGISYFYTYRAAGKEDKPDLKVRNGSMAGSFFTQINWKPVTVSAEMTYGQKRNDLVMNLDTFVGDATYAKSLSGRKSLGLLGLLEVTLNPKWKTFYEYDQINFDTRYRADRFEKHGVGFKWAFHSQSDLEARVEFPLEGREGLQVANTTGVLALHAWF